MLFQLLVLVLCLGLTQAQIAQLKEDNFQAKTQNGLYVLYLFVEFFYHSDVQLCPLVPALQEPRSCCHRGSVEV